MTVYAVRAGGLGNQLFQLAAAIAFDAEGDGRLLPAPGGHQLSVEELAPGLNPHVSLRERVRLGRVFGDEPAWWRWPAHKALGPLRHRLGPRTYRAHAPGLPGAYEPRRPSEPTPLVLIGYFQHPDFYRAVLPRLLDALIAAAPTGMVPRPGGHAAVVVRAGDYRVHRWVLADEYYTAALRAHPLATADVVGEEPQRCAEVAQLLHAGGCAAELATGSAVEDFWRIATAPHVVMANSTFCWWAVQVGDEMYRRGGLRRTVVVPGEWLGNGLGDRLVEADWIAR